MKQVAWNRFGEKLIKFCMELMVFMVWLPTAKNWHLTVWESWEWWLTAVWFSVVARASAQTQIIFTYRFAKRDNPANSCNGTTTSKPSFYFQYRTLKSCLVKTSPNSSSHSNFTHFGFDPSWSHQPEPVIWAEFRCLFMSSTWSCTRIKLININ